MKKLTKFSATAAVAVVLLLVSSGIFSSTWAQEAASESALLQKLDLLIEQLTILSTSSSKHIETSNEIGLQYTASGTDVPGCLDNYNTLPSSTTFNYSAPWSTVNFYNGSNSTAGYQEKINNFVDINGDGLNDYFYRYSYVYSSKRREEACVLLNNGSGWDVAYRCLTINGTYYGDCAQI